MNIGTVVVCLIVGFSLAEAVRQPAKAQMPAAFQTTSR